MAHLARLVGCALISVVSGTYTDLKCFSHYSVSSNHYLNHTGIVSVTTERNLGLCASMCQLDYRCVSANFAADQQCQLLTINEESTLTYDVQWIHITLKWTNTSFSKNSIKPTLVEKSKAFVSVGYNSITDKYHRASDGPMDEMILGWDAITFTNANIARYVTTTEPTTSPTTTRPTTTTPATEVPTDIYSYLYRESNDITDAEISWNFDFSDTLLRVVDVFIDGTMHLYRGGNITYNICDEKSSCIEGSGVDVETSVFAGAKQLTVKFILSGESDDFPILFPVSIYAPEDTFGFFVNITMTDDCQYMNDVI